MLHACRQVWKFPKFNKNAGQLCQHNYPKYYVVHLTLTVAENVREVDFKHFHRVIQFINQRLKRDGAEFKYVACKDFQKRGQSTNMSSAYRKSIMPSLPLMK